MKSHRRHCENVAWPWSFSLLDSSGDCDWVGRRLCQNLSSFYIRVTSQITRRRREIIHLKTPDFAARVHWVVIRHVALRVQKPVSIGQVVAEFRVQCINVRIVVRDIEYGAL